MPLLSFALLVSVLINVAFVSGCSCFKCKCCEDVENCKLVEEERKSLKVIAKGFGLDSNKTTIDIRDDILELVKKSRKMPTPLSEKTIADLRTLLTKEEIKILDEYQKAIRDAQGKKVLYLPIDGE